MGREGGSEHERKRDGGISAAQECETEKDVPQRKRENLGRGGAGGGVVVKRYQDSLGDAGEGICIYSYLIKPSDSFVFSLEASLCVDHLLMTTANSSAAQTDHFNPPIIRRKDTLIH